MDFFSITLNAEFFFISMVNVVSPAFVEIFMNIIQEFMKY